jgi:hypothetical protein
LAPSSAAQNTWRDKGATMRMKTEDRWHCTNPACRCEVQVEQSAAVDGENPRCSCGSPMKKRYASPALTYLDFLRMDETPKVTARKE